MNGRQRALKAAYVGLWWVIYLTLAMLGYWTFRRFVEPGLTLQWIGGFMAIIWISDRLATKALGYRWDGS